MPVDFERKLGVPRLESKLFSFERKVTMTIQIKNIFHATDGVAGTEDFLTLLKSSQVKIQRIVSRSSATPENEWYDQAHSEWVLVVRGRAVLEFEEGQRMELKEGDYLTLPPRARHRVSETGPETIWLVVHIPEQTD
jgi:cupin 2 domain-containing protein